jgi:hypothetical protein
VYYVSIDEVRCDIYDMTSRGHNCENPKTCDTTSQQQTVLAVLDILKGSENGVMHFEESCFWTLSIVQSFFFKNNVSQAGSASVFR